MWILFILVLFLAPRMVNKMNCECDESFITLPDVHLLLSMADSSLQGHINHNTNDHETFLSESED